MDKNEIWRPLEHPMVKPGSCEVSDLGHVRNAKTKKEYKTQLSRSSNSVIVQVPRSFGKHKYHTIYVAKAVATAFVPNPNKYTILKYIDGDTSNCRAGNIVWVKCRRMPSLEELRKKVYPYNILLKMKDGTYDVLKNVPKSKLIDRMNIIISMMHRRMRTVFILKYKEDKTNKQISEYMMISLSAVSEHLMRGYAKISNNIDYLRDGEKEKSPITLNTPLCMLDVDSRIHNALARYCDVVGMDTTLQDIIYYDNNENIRIIKIRGIGDGGEKKILEMIKNMENKEEK